MFRYFEIADDKFSMYSKFDSEFGESILLTSGFLSLENSEDNGSIGQVLVSGDGLSIPFSLRISEMEFFLSVFRLFNPQILSDYEKKTQSQPAPPDFPF